MCGVVTGISGRWKPRWLGLEFQDDATGSGGGSLGSNLALRGDLS